MRRIRLTRQVRLSAIKEPPAPTLLPAIAGNGDARARAVVCVASFGDAGNLLSLGRRLRPTNTQCGVWRELRSVAMASAYPTDRKTGTVHASSGTPSASLFTQPSINLPFGNAAASFDMRRRSDVVLQLAQFLAQTLITRDTLSDDGVVDRTLSRISPKTAARRDFYRQLYLHDLFNSEMLIGIHQFFANTSLRRFIKNSSSHYRCKPNPHAGLCAGVKMTASLYPVDSSERQPKWNNKARLPAAEGG